MRIWRLEIIWHNPKLPSMPWTAMRFANKVQKIVDEFSEEWRLDRFSSRIAKIKAIRILRPDVGLVEAKEWIDRWMK